MSSSVDNHSYLPVISKASPQSEMKDNHPTAHLLFLYLYFKCSCAMKVTMPFEGLFTERVQQCFRIISLCFDCLLEKTSTGCVCLTNDSFALLIFSGVQMEIVVNSTVAPHMCDWNPLNTISVKWLHSSSVTMGCIWHETGDIFNLL